MHLRGFSVVHSKLINQRAKGGLVLRVGAVLGASLYALACTGEVKQDAPQEAPPVPVVQAPPEVKAPVEAVAPPPEPELKPLLQAQVEDILNRTCGECHGADGSKEAGMNYIEDLDALATNGKIVPGDAEGSLLVRRLRAGTMPPSGHKPPSSDEIEQIASFIDSWDGPEQVAKPVTCDNQRITFDDIYSAIQGDLIQQDADDREFIRYVGVTNRFNSGACGKDLDTDRFALSKMLNSLSTETRINNPVAIDPDETIYRIDIREFGWDRNVNGAADGWEAILQDSDYAVEFEGDEADFIKQEANTTVPFMYSDAIVDVAVTGDLYYALIDVPGDVNTLQNDLGVDVQDDLDRGLVVRAGTTESGVSRGSRLVERHEIAVGANRVYWQAFEFNDGENSQMFTNPLDFNVGGSEAIFSLPNGLHGYVIFDENGNTVEESNLLFDTLADDFKARAAESCMTCHNNGFLVVKDEVRTFVEDNSLDFDNDTFDTVTEVYPNVEEFSVIVNDDREAYRAALGRAKVPLGVADPISQTFVRFDKKVNAATAAGDLGIQPDLLDRSLVRLDPNLRTLGSNIGVKRDEFSRLYFDSLCVILRNSNNHPVNCPNQ